MIKAYDQYEVWFVTGAQLLYGGDAVTIVDGHSNEMVKGLNDSGNLPVKVVYKGTANSSKEVEAVFKAANNDDRCIGVITWMHTFSPAKMWIHGLLQLKKPLTETASSAISAPVCVSAERWLWDTGRMRRPSARSLYGCAYVQVGLTLRIC